MFAQLAICLFFFSEESLDKYLWKTKLQSSKRLYFEANDLRLLTPLGNYPLATIGIFKCSNNPLTSVDNSKFSPVSCCRKCRRHLLNLCAQGRNTRSRYDKYLAIDLHRKISPATYSSKGSFLRNCENCFWRIVSVARSFKTAPGLEAIRRFERFYHFPLT